MRERKRLGWNERGWRGPSWGPYSLLHLPGLWRKSVSCTNDSQTAQQTGLGSLRRPCSISGSASPFIFLFPAPYTFFHLHNLPLGLVLPSLPILSGQLSGSAWNISFIGTAECMFIYPLYSSVFWSLGQVIKSSMKYSNFIQQLQSVSLFQYTVLLWQLPVWYLYKNKLICMLLTVGEKIDTTVDATNVVMSAC